MILGRGDIASVIQDNDNLVFFACGVSNSLCDDLSEFEREKTRLKNTIIDNPTKRLVYFSTLSIYHKDTLYTRHKRDMERLIKVFSEKYCIIRLGNITWGDNPHTIINTFKRVIRASYPVRIAEEFKYLCTKEEFNYWIDMIPDFNTEMNITGERVTVNELYARVKYGIL